MHLPSAQVYGISQKWLQVPQLYKSRDVFTHSPLQQVSPPRHRRLQPPQLSLSFWGSTQPEPHRVVLPVQVQSP
jgi:hypothetical protein